MNLLLLVLAFIAVANSATIYGGQKESVKVYDSYSVFKLQPIKEWQRNIIHQLLANTDDFDLWFENKHEMHVMVSPKVVNFFKNLTHLVKITTELWLPNVQSLINEEKQETPSKLDKSDDNSNTFGWKKYHTFEEIYQFMDDILTTYPNVTESIDIGQTYEGRTIAGIKISYKFGNPGIYIESNIHAREWITSATATWLINELLTSQDKDVRDLATNYDWYIIPVFNVDGFVYSHDVDRMWRKNRHPSPLKPGCIGIDLNRNWDAHWMENGGASSNPCSTVFAGDYAHSEPETKAQAAYIKSIQGKINILLAFHSYSQVVLSPWGYTEEKPSNAADLKTIGNAYVDAVAALPYKKEYIAGGTAEVLYVASGPTNDWAYEQGIQLAYTIEFRDTGHFGFVLPPVQILSNCEETMAGLIAMTKKAKELGYMTVKSN